jgi:hypothetical protein
VYIGASFSGRSLSIPITPGGLHLKTQGKHRPLLAVLKLCFYFLRGCKVDKGAAEYYVASFTAHGMEHRKFLAFVHFSLVSSSHILLTSEPE